VIYVPQGSWHGLKAAEPTDIMWVVSPPNFARSLREAQAAGTSGLTDSKREDIARKHQQSDSRAFLRRILANSEWNGDEPWGRVTFDADGLTATYQTPSGGGSLEIRDERKEDLGFIGNWKNSAGERGEFILTYDFASGTEITLKSGEEFQRRSILRLVR
jgi:hypothetical protein